MYSLILVVSSFALAGPAVHEAVNPAQGLRATFSARGVRVSPLETEAWTLELAVTGERAGLEGWIENREQGLVQGFTIDPRPGEETADQPLSIELSLRGDLSPKLSEDRQVLDLYFKGVQVLRYGDLRATDAGGADVPVRMEASGDSGLRLVLERTGVAYPVVVEGVFASGRGARDDRVDFPTVVPEAPPPNDDCTGANDIPGAGPFPYLTPVFDITDASTASTGDPPRPSCAVDPVLARSIWFTFTPASSGSYTLSTCANLGTGTTVDDPVMAIYTSTAGCSGPFTEIPTSGTSDGCDDDSCDVGAFQPFITTTLGAGTTYYVVVWNSGSVPPSSGHSSLALRVSQPGTPPPNDTCAGGSSAPYTLPPAGPFPYLTPVTADITDATSAGDPPTPSCVPGGFTATRSTWYTFTPAATGTYSISSCASETATTVDDTLIAIYTSAGGCPQIPADGVSVGCDDDACAFENFQAVVSANLAAGTTYYIVVYKVGTAPPAPGNTAVQLRINPVVPPANDTCAGAVALALDVPIDRTNALAANDYQLSSPSTTCYTGVGQTTSSAVGRDTVYSFTAPGAGNYSFRAQLTGSAGGGNLVLWTSPTCPQAPPTQTIACSTGVTATNRNANNTQFVAAEEIMCLPLTAGQTIYLFVDESSLTTMGGDYVLEVRGCTRETEPNNTPATANSLACGIEGTISPAVDADFYSLGTLPAGARVFALADGAAGKTSDFDMRVTTTTDTLEYDDLDADLPFGPSSPTCDGTPLTGVAAFLRVSVSTFTSQAAEPYRLYAVAEPPIGMAAAETEPNDTAGAANQSPGGYFSGSLSGASPSTDVDFYTFQATAGDLIFLGLDGDPLRDRTPLNARLTLLDAGLVTLVTVDDPDSSSSTASGAGSLTATTPRSPGEALTWRARTTGTYYAKVEAGSLSNTPRAGDYLLSIARNCAGFDTDGDGVGDLYDCRPTDPTVSGIPGEATGLSFAPDRSMLSWTSAGGGSATVHDVLRGALASLPVGPGGGDEFCFNDIAGTTVSDSTIPSAGAGLWYLVRGANVCGVGSYGHEGVNGAPGTERTSTTCP